MEPKVLDAGKPQSVGYCIPEFLRDLQIQANVARPNVGRIERVDELRQHPIALVNFGPSLGQTWEAIRDFKYVMSCSGAHQFLVDHGIIPTWHVDVDPRAHKVKLLGTPQRETEYLDALQKVRVWKLSGRTLYLEDSGPELLVFRRRS